MDKLKDKKDRTHEELIEHANKLTEEFVGYTKKQVDIIIGIIDRKTTSRAIVE